MIATLATPGTFTSAGSDENRPSRTSLTQRCACFHQAARLKIYAVTSPSRGNTVNTSVAKPPIVVR
mgnify:CR=1 FL=1